MIINVCYVEHSRHFQPPFDLTLLEHFPTFPLSHFPTSAKAVSSASTLGLHNRFFRHLFLLLSYNLLVFSLSNQNHIQVPLILTSTSSTEQPDTSIIMQIFVKTRKLTPLLKLLPLPSSFTY